jgi:ABC-type transport system involved in cytochrome bd biosynthesis fused ATPase/permease subunit
LSKPFKQTFVGKAMFGDEYPAVVFIRRMFSTGLMVKIGAVAGAVAGAALGLHIGMAAAAGALLLGCVMTARVLLSRKTVAGANTPKEKTRARVRKSIPLALSTVWVMGTSMLLLPGKKDIFNKNADKEKYAVVAMVPPQPPAPDYTEFYSARKT